VNADSTAAAMICKKCGQPNRVPRHRTTPGIYRCGKCRGVLRNDLSFYLRLLRASTWITFFPMAILLITFSGLLLMWIGEWPWWISLPVAIVLLPLPALSAFWPVSYTPNPRVAATIMIAFWILLEGFTLITTGLTLPWHQDVIRFLIDIAAITGATWAGLGRSPREFVRVITRPIAINRSKQKSMQQSESTSKVKPAKKSMLDTIVDGLKNLKAGEWQEICRKLDEEEDRALGRSTSKDS
jgi:hypothetical protein